MGNASQRSGSTFNGAHDDFYYFDKLPPSARKALADAAFDWSSGAVYNRFKKAAKGYRTGKEIAQTVPQWDKKQIAKDKKRVWNR